jgi:hypothetical protein
MKFGLGSASGIAGAIQGFAGIENQKMQYQQELNKILAQGKADKEDNAPTQNAATNVPMPVAPPYIPPKLFPNGPGGVNVNVGMSGYKTLEDRIREYLGDPGKIAYPSTGTNIPYQQTTSNAGVNILPGHQDLGSGLTFHPPTNTYFHNGQPVMSLLS